MYSIHHAAVSLFVTIGLVSVLPPIVVGDAALPVALVVGYGTAIGVLVDLDHFLIARHKTGHWGAVRRCLSAPSVPFVDQDRIFEQGDVGILSRLLSHLVIAGGSVAVLVAVSVPLATLTAVVLYAHVCCDVWWDIRRLGGFSDCTTDELIGEMR